MCCLLPAAKRLPSHMADPEGDNIGTIGEEATIIMRQTQLPQKLSNIWILEISKKEKDMRTHNLVVAANKRGEALISSVAGSQVVWFVVTKQKARRVCLIKVRIVKSSS